jgi:hypothetical protein
MWPADEVGQVHEVETEYSHWTCDPYIDEGTSGMMAAHKAADAATACAEEEQSGEGEIGTHTAARGLTSFLVTGAGSGQCAAVSLGSGDAHGSKCEAPKVNMTLKIQVMATAPRVFVIENFLSEVEADHLVALGAPSVERSTTQGEVSHDAGRGESPRRER